MFEEYEYLRLPLVIAKTIQHPEEYMKKGEGPNAIRRIFKNVPYDKEEKRIIQIFKEQLTINNITINPDSQTIDVFLRFLYASQFDLEKSKDAFTEHMKWLRDPHNYQIDKYVIEIYNKGLIYLAGRDKQYRPTLIVNTDLINANQYNIQTITRALSIICIIMEDYYFSNGKVENWNVILDLKERTSLAFKLDEYYKIFNTMSQNFPSTVEKIYCVNPSLSVQLQWNELIDSIPTKKKLQLLLDYSPLKKIFEPNQLEKKYGGKLENIKQFWPPLNTLSEAKQFIETLKPQQLQSNPQDFQQSVQQEIVKLSVSQKKSLQQTNAMQIQDQYIKPRDFSVFPQETVNDFRLLPSETDLRATQQEPYRNISKYNRMTVQNQQMQNKEIKLSLRPQTMPQNQQQQQQIRESEIPPNILDQSQEKIDDNYSACFIY